MDGADLVGYIVGEDQAGWFTYACDEHTPAAMREDHRQLLREEASEVGATCHECGLELFEAEGMDE